ncbi:hypothetical protein MOJ79_02260 [Calidifontimicrobium sp. SYSU G02091]|uniref:hypothetical protein n=1 Tax=Calidifontimicrobium sp. SYSU G02091 TaxID=2926421 RepID=UPI001F53BDD0|nr:hypothetical protein [Calidifontimicrobium sp. SYSU G02091]MCI1190660.1 hypothetical protein [Calidifontimicrobium sp. SYSU G02091]
MALSLLVHASWPASVAAAVAATTAPQGAAWLGRVPEVFAILALPYAVWMLVSVWVAACRRTIVGGVVGLHLDLLVVGAMVASSAESHAANGWLLYLFSAPVAALAGAAVARWLAVSGAAGGAKRGRGG